MKKRMISMLLVLALCAALLPTIALATDSYEVVVAGIDVTSDNCGNVLGDGTVSFNPAGENGRTLTLNNAKITCSSSGSWGCAIMDYNDNTPKPDALTIALVGENTITVSSSYSGSDLSQVAAIVSMGDLTITGPGSLKIQFGNISGNGSQKALHGIEISFGDLCIEGGAKVTIGDATAKTAKDAIRSAGIYVLCGDMTVSGEGTEVIACGENLAPKNVTGDYVNSYGVNLQGSNGGGNLTLEGGAKLTATGGAVTAPAGAWAYSSGLDDTWIGEGSIRIKDGSQLTVTGSEASSNIGAVSYGLAFMSRELIVEKGGHLIAKTTSSAAGATAISIMEEYIPGTITLGTPYFWRTATNVASTASSEQEFVFDDNKVKTYIEISPTEQSANSDELPDLGQYGGALIVGGMVSGLLDGSASVLGATFADVPHGAYYYNAVEWAYNKGVAGGVDSKHFAPDDSCTRAQAVTMLWRAVGCPDVWGENPFVDVDTDDYYYKAVLWAVAMGITSGTDEDHFSPDEPCTRGQIVTFLHREARCYQAHENYAFVDVKNGSYCEDAVNWAVSCGITNGTSEATFSPDAVCTRAQIVTFLYRNR